MKKGFAFLLLLFVLGFCFAAPVAAQETEWFIYDVDDDADEYLDAETVWDLNTAAAEISERYNCGVYAAIFPDMSEYEDEWGNTYYDIEEFSEAVYTAWELGYSEGGDGILLVMSMAERDFDLVAYGDFANYAFTDYGKSVLQEEFLDNFRQNDWAGGFEDYINACGTLLSCAAEGEPLDISYSDSIYDDDVYYTDMPVTRATAAERVTDALPAGSAIGVIVGLIYSAVLKAKMKSVRKAVEADDYVCEHGVQMTCAVDQFSHTTVVRQHIDHDSGSRSGGGGGGTSVNSGGFSHSSGKF